MRSIRTYPVKTKKKKKRGWDFLSGLSAFMSVIISLIFAGDTMVTQKLARQYFEKSWNARVKKKDFEGFDDGIVPMLLDMNKLDGVTTVFSCGGHPEGQSFYIAFALSKGGAKKIVSIYKKILKKTSKLKIFLGNIELEYSRLFPDEKPSKILTKCPKKNRSDFLVHHLHAVLF